MSAAPQIPLVNLVERRIRSAYAGAPRWMRKDDAWIAAAQAAIDACHAEEMREALQAAHAHVQELRDAWERGAISEHDGLGGTRSNRNVDVEVQLRDLLDKLGARS